MPSDLRRDTVKIGDLLSIAEQIQTFGLARKTGEIFVTNVPAPARINIVEGAVVDAQFGLLSGLDAAIALINLEDPQSDFIVGEKSSRQTIDKPYVEILCEAAMAKDQSLAAQTANLTGMLPTQPYLRVMLGADSVTFPIREGRMGIGRSLANEIILNEATVSQEHAYFEYSPQGVFLKDLGSKNGTYLDGDKIEERWLGEQADLQFGSVRCHFIGGAKKAAAAA